MNSENLHESIKEFSQKGYVTEAERKILLIKAKSVDISETALDILIRQETESGKNLNAATTGSASTGVSPISSEGNTNKTVLLGILGFFLGIPVSYFFQHEKIRASFSVPQYLAKLPELLKSDEASHFITPIIMAVVITTVVGVLIGYALDKK